jgi:hypothetical protein
MRFSTMVELSIHFPSIFALIRIQAPAAVRENYYDFRIHFWFTRFLFASNADARVFLIDSPIDKELSL